jgi:O-antigen/teichoic acid export membrane protein
MCQPSSEFSAVAMARSSSSGAIAQALHLATRFLLTPFVVMGVGLEAYAYWSLLFALLGWIGLHRTGFISAAVPLATAKLAAGQRAQAEELLRAAAGIVTILGIACVLIAWGGGGTLARWLDVASDSKADARLCLMIAVTATSLSLVGAGFQNSLEARNAFPTVKAVEIGSAFLESALIVVALSMNTGLSGLATAYALRLTAQTLGCAFFAHRQSPGLQVLPGRASFASWQRVWRFGLAMQGIGFLHLSIGSIDRLLFVRLLGLGTAGLMELARKLVGFAAGIVAQGLAPLEPAVAHLEIRSPRSVAVIVERSARLVGFFGLVPLTVLAAAPEIILRAWLGTVPSDAPFVLRVVALSSYIHLSTGPWTAALRGLARPRLETGYAALWLLLLLVGVPAGQILGGLRGAVIGAAAAQSIASLTLILLAARRFECPPSQVLRGLLHAIALGGVVVALVATLIGASAPPLDRIDAILRAGTVGLATVVFLVPLAAWVLLNSGDRAAIGAALKRRAASLPAQEITELAA